MGTTEAAQDISFAAMKEKQEQVVQTVMQDPAVQAVGSFFGGGTGSALNNGRMFISLKPKGWGKDHRRKTLAQSSHGCGRSSRKFPVPNFSSLPARTFESAADRQKRNINTRCPIKTSTS
jgi:multidrug efflux pump subunit AcrB